jgi:hypothetical protein
LKITRDSAFKRQLCIVLQTNLCWELNLLKTFFPSIPIRAIFYEILTPLKTFSFRSLAKCVALNRGLSAERYQQHFIDSNFDIPAIPMLSPIDFPTSPFTSSFPPLNSL